MAALFGGLVVASLTGCSASGAPDDGDAGARPASPSGPGTTPPSSGGGATGDGGAGGAGDDAPGRPPAPGASDAFSTALVAYVDCMTEHGVEGLDREAAARGSLSLTGVDHDNPVFRAADVACSDAIADFGGGAPGASAPGGRAPAAGVAGGPAGAR